MMEGEHHNMQMTNGEIAREYTQAKKKREQIDILAQLNQCSKETIKEILRSEGVKLPGCGKQTECACKSKDVKTVEQVIAPGVAKKVTVQKVPDFVIYAVEEQFTANDEYIDELKGICEGLEERLEDYRNQVEKLETENRQLKEWIEEQEEEIAS